MADSQYLEYTDKKEARAIGFLDFFLYASTDTFLVLHLGLLNRKIFTWEK